MSYENAEQEIRDSVINLSNAHELGKKDTVAILTYLIHDIMTIKEDDGKQEGSMNPCENCGSMRIVQVGRKQTCQSCLNEWDAFPELPPED